MGHYPQKLVPPAEPTALHFLKNPRWPGSSHSSNVSILEQFLTTCPGICVACNGKSGSRPGPLGGLLAVGDDGCPELEDAEEGCVAGVLEELDWFCLDYKQQQQQKKCYIR